MPFSIAVILTACSMVKLFARVGAQVNNIEKIIPAIINEKIFLISSTPLVGTRNWELGTSFYYSLIPTSS